MYETEHDNDVAMLMAVIETAADAIDTEGVIRLLCELTDARKSVAKLAERNVELALDSANRDREFDRLVAAIDAERADYQRFRNMAGEEANAAREINAAAIEERDFWKKRANELADSMTADVQPLLVGDPLVATARVYRDSRNKITAINAMRSYTGLGLHEAKLAVEQIIKIMEMKEATE